MLSSLQSKRVHDSRTHARLLDSSVIKPEFTGEFSQPVINSSRKLLKDLVDMQKSNIALSDEELREARKKASLKVLYFGTLTI